jgi:hypothetical protein
MVKYPYVSGCDMALWKTRMQVNNVWEQQLIWVLVILYQNRLGWRSISIIAE